MDRKTIAVKGAGIGVASQLVNLVAKFVVRTFAIRYLGMELLGLDSVLIDIVSMLSLAEMGLTSAMLFRLYKPIIDDDKKRVSVLMASYRMIYHIIAAVITVLGIIIFFFLPYIVKNISITWEQIYFAYVLQLICSISSYILAYQRILLNADQKKHLCLLVDMIATVIFSALKVFVIVLLHSYLFYLVLNIFQIIIANIVLKIYSFRTYSYIDSKEKCDKADLRVILNDTKEVLGGKIAGYIYSGTDNMIISIVLGTGIVGILSNYKYISSAMKGIVNSTMSTIQPLIGNYLNSDATKSSSFRTLLRYTFIRYLIAGISTCAFTTISDSFVQIWAKSDAVVMSYSISLLLAGDYYIGCVYGPLNEYLIGLGEFKLSKIAMSIGAFVNIAFSLLGVLTIGCEGVLLATVLSQSVLWIVNGIIVFRSYYNNEYGYIYLKKQVAYICGLIISIVVSLVATKLLPTDNLVYRCILGGLVSGSVFFLISVLLFGRTEEFRFIYGLLNARLRDN